VSQAVAAAIEAEGVDIFPVAEAEALLVDAGLPPEQAATIAADYGAAELDGLRVALLAVAVIALLAFWFTRRLPEHATGDGVATPVAPDTPDAVEVDPGHAS